MYTLFLSFSYTYINAHLYILICLNYTKRGRARAIGWAANTKAPLSPRIQRVL